LDFLREEKKDTNTVQLIHDELKKRLEKLKDYKVADNKEYHKGIFQMNKLLRKQIRSTVKMAQKNIDKQVKGFLKCEAGRKKRIASGEKNKKKYEASSKLHKACRKEESKFLTDAGKCDDIMKQYNKLYEASLAKIQAYDLLQPQIDCKRTYNESDFAYAKRLRNKFKTDYEVFLPVKANHVRIVKEVDSSKTQCAAVQKAYAKVAKRCKKTAEKMDSAACYYASYTQEACDHFEECRPRYYGSWMQAKKSAEKLVKPLPPQWAVTGQTRCLLQLLEKTFNDEKFDKKDIKNCDDCKIGHCEDWGTVIDYKEDELPKEQNCSIPVEFPCNKAYYKKEYGDLPKGIEATCLPCEGIKAGKGGKKENEKKGGKKEEKKKEEKKEEKKKEEKKKK